MDDALIVSCIEQQRLIATVASTLSKPYRGILSSLGHVTRHAAAKCFMDTVELQGRAFNVTM